MHIAVIGAGAAGCFAAIGIKRRLPEADVTIYEGGKRQLAKVSVTGGGRCNLTNSFNQVKSLAHIYPRGERLMKRLLKGFSHTDAYEWFENEGVRLTTQEDECVFPVSQDAMEIVNTLTQIINRLGIRLLTGHRVELISHDKENGKYSLRFGGNRSSATADCVVVAIGGTPAASQLNMFSPLDIITENPVPSLFSMCLPGDGITKLMGTVVEEATTSIPGTKFKADGPLLITHWGMSGPAIFPVAVRMVWHVERFPCVSLLSSCSRRSRFPRESWVCIVFTGRPSARAASSGDFSSSRHSLHTGRYGSFNFAIAARMSWVPARSSATSSAGGASPGGIPSSPGSTA